MESAGYHNTWVKPHVLSELLESYQFVVFIDADATIQHLELPIEWLFNRWGITPTTSIAMPLDTRQILNGDENASNDSKGKLALNTGVVIAQSLPYTFEMLTAWKECPLEKSTRVAASGSRTGRTSKKPSPSTSGGTTTPPAPRLWKSPATTQWGTPG